MRRGAWAAGLAVVVAVLAGCSEPGQPSTTLPTAASTSAAAPTLEPLGPADFPVPAEAREQTEAGARAMATYYLDLISFVTETSPSASRSIVDLSSNCSTCLQITEGVEAVAAAGQRIEGAGLTVQSFGSTSVSGGAASIVWLVAEAPSRTFDSGGQEVPAEARPGQQLSGGIDLAWNSDRVAWVVTQVALESL